MALLTKCTWNWRKCLFICWHSPLRTCCSRSLFPSASPVKRCEESGNTILDNPCSWSKSMIKQCWSTEINRRPAIGSTILFWSLSFKQLNSKLIFVCGFASSMRPLVISKTFILSRPILQICFLSRALYITELAYYMWMLRKNPERFVTAFNLWSQGNISLKKKTEVCISHISSLIFWQLSLIQFPLNKLTRSLCSQELHSASIYLMPPFLTGDLGNAEYTDLLVWRTFTFPRQDMQTRWRKFGSRISRKRIRRSELCTRMNESGIRSLKIRSTFIWNVFFLIKNGLSESRPFLRTAWELLQIVSDKQYSERPKLANKNISPDDFNKYEIPFQAGYFGALMLKKMAGLAVSLECIHSRHLI